MPLSCESCATLTNVLGDGIAIQYAARLAIKAYDESSAETSMFGKRRLADSVATLYGRLVDQARRPEFYTHLSVPDSVEGRFELVVMHCWLAQRRLVALEPESVAVSRGLLELMFDDIDRSIRELGVGDVSVGKYMKRLGKAFYGRAEAYDAALATSSADMAATLRRNVLGTAVGDEEMLNRSSTALADYVVTADSSLANTSLAELRQGALIFPEIMETVHAA